MAAEVPVCDLLCESVEYLLKLGTNLRIRSESLKEKRIRKEKLINSHAIKKAADKVLLICRLSQKSLDNVEAGVKSVLSLVDRSQASTNDGAKTSTHNKEISKTKYQYFRCGSRKLRICKKVPIKHYMSVKVVASQMLPLIQDKYPVYYDCKLFRLRKKSSENSQRENINISDDSVNMDHSEKSKEFSKTKDEKGNIVDKHSNLKCKHNKLVNDSSDSNSNDNSANKQNEDNLNSTVKQIIDNINLWQGDVVEVTENDPKRKKNEDQNSGKRKCNDFRSENIIDNVQNSLETIEEKKNSSLNGEHKEIDKDDCEESKKRDENIQDNALINMLTLENNESNVNNATVEIEETELSKHQVGKDKEIINSKRNIWCESNEGEKADEMVEDNNSEIAIQSNPEMKNRESHGSVISLSQSEPEAEESNSVIKEKKITEHFSEQGSEDEMSIDKFKTKSNTEENEESSDICNKRRESSLSDNSKKESMTRKSEEHEDLQKMCQSKRRRVLESDNESNNSDGSPEEKNKHIKEGDQRPVDRPLIRCVSIGKLLKSDMIPSKDLELHPKEKSLESNKSLNEQELQSKENKSGSRYKNVREKNERKRDIYKTKREKEEKKRVRAFKAKNFVININKLPKFTKKFLLKHSLKRITQNGSVIFALKDITDSATCDVLHIDRKCDEIKDKTEEETPRKEMAKLKCALLNDSDSDQQGDEQENVVDKKNSNKEEEYPNDVNSSLHNDSSDNDAPETTNNKVQKAKNSTPRIRRKRVKKIMDARKMLLSSDTDDEQSQNENELRGGKSSSECENDVGKQVKDNENELRGGKSSSECENVVVKQVKEYIIKKSQKLSSDEDSDNESTIKKTSHGLDPDSENSKMTEESRVEIENTEIINENVDGHSSSNNKMVRSKSKPSGSSSQNSENQEDKDVDRLTDLNTLTKTRRRHESTETENSNSTKSEKKKAKASLLSDVKFLGEDSDAASIAESEPADVEDLPTMSVPALNGDDVDRLAVDDLLDESDSSSHNGSEQQKESQDNKKEDTDDSENVRSKRRKAHAISSDSEVGSSRPKQKIKMSDFEDSEEENSEPIKKNKRKKKDIDSDASTSSSVESKKKRRRIKTVDDSDASDSDTENEGRNKHGRKNIRKVMGKDQLEEATKKAARQEKERIARIAERQKVYNNLEFDESGKPDEVVLEKVVLDFDPGTKEPLIEVDRGLVKKLKPHQANGIKFMWDACFESVKRIKKDKGSGCILAHCMGLGKTLQVVTLTHTLLTHSSLTGVNRVLVVCPLSTVLNWVNEFRMWLKHTEADFEVDIYELSRYKQNSERAYQLQQWFEGGGVCVLGYEMFRNLSADNVKKFKKKMLKNFQEALVDPGPDLVVCDEGHLLKNEKTSLSQSMNRVKTLRRIVLTGTPLQNNLKEYYCMVQFVKPNLLGKYNEYLNRFVNPITNGQYTDSTEHDIRVMKRRSHVLHKMLDGAVQRRDYGVLAPFLPPKHEYVLFITLTEMQIKLYQYYLDNYSRRPLPGKSSGFLFPDFQAMQRIWTHPLVLKYNSERYEIMQQKKREREEEDSEGSLADFIDDDSTSEETSTEESSDDLSDVSDDSRKKSKKKKSTKKKGKDSKVSTRRGTRANPELEEERASSDVEEIKNENPTEWWIKMMEEDELENLRNSHKLVLLFEILRQCETIGDKLLVFSQSLYSLDLIEHFLGKVDEATQEGRIDEKLGGHVGSWSPGIDYFRLDGSTSCENRSIWCKNFNREDNPRARLFLISTRAGGLGINLVAANRVVIFDVSWNPSHDVQSIFRVYRFGQKKPCYVYRFLAMGTMEEKIYERQVTKQAISKRVIDEQQIDRHYAENDLAELYKFEPHPPSPRPLPPLPKDRLFAEMLKEHESQIYKYHEHDSLLENKEEETLSEEERKAAWEDFENEKNRPPPAPFPATWPMHNGMAPNMWAQQQQQLAYAAIAAMLRKDMPNINDNQIRDMLPHIFNSNPAMFGGYDYGLMQKMAEIYKYPQPTMMNPGMMNPVMNPTGGMGGTSGLQYEPPWQRQQQQMRLHQLMQHQNSSGAKYYAGGLGSRDPVAMALQQQRAREIMLGERAAGRPRGRPPLQPRAPSATPTSDVVNLDSD